MICFDVYIENDFDMKIKLICVGNQLTGFYMTATSVFNELIFYLILVLKVLNRQFYSRVSLFFFISIANEFSVKNFVV